MCLAHDSFQYRAKLVGLFSGSFGYVLGIQWTSGCRTRRIEWTSPPGPLRPFLPKISLTFARILLMGLVARRKEYVLSQTAIETLRGTTFTDLGTAATDREAIGLLLQSLKGNQNVLDVEALGRAVMDRQAVDPPLLPSGIAFPHARTDAVKTIVMAVGSVRTPIQIGEATVRLFILLGVPKAAVTEYLELTSFLARHFRSGDLVEKLLTAKNINEFLAELAVG
jgi:fructose PTS system EIIA component